MVTSRSYILLIVCYCLFASLSPAADLEPEPLVIGQTWTLESGTLQETRRINVYLPPAYAELADAVFPVLYMPDGGIGEDFLHIAGLLQISTLNTTMRPFILVGIENTERRRDLTGPTEVAEDKEIAPIVGGSAAFRTFLREELFPEVERRYRTADERAIVGESLAGLFVVETLLLAPEMFDTYIAVDPSLWWNAEQLVQEAPERLGRLNLRGKSLYLASSDTPEIGAPTQRLSESLTHLAPEEMNWIYESMPAEQHWTIFHPAALQAFRALLGPGDATGNPAE